MHLETFYSNLINQQIERDGRIHKLEGMMEKEGLHEEQVEISGNIHTHIYKINIHKINFFLVQLFQRLTAS